MDFLKTYETFPVEIVRAQAREHLTHARARCASTDRRTRETREQRQARAREVREQGARALRARSLRTRARANKLSKSGFGELICDLESLFARAESLFARARILALLVHLARAPLFARASRARACRCSRTSRAHVLNARALALRTPQLSPIHAPPILSCPATGSYPSITVNEPALPPLVKRTSSCGFLQVFSFFIVHISYSFATRLNRQVSGFLLLSLLWWLHLVDADFVDVLFLLI